MEEENQMIKKPKLSFFQRLRKFMLLRTINEKNYKKAPYYLKTDEDIIAMLIKKNPSNIKLLNMSQQLSILEEKPELFNNIPKERRLEILGTNPEYIAQYHEGAAINYILKNSKKEYIKYLPEELQVKLLTKENSFFVEMGRDIKTHPDGFKGDLENFSPEVVEKTVLTLIAEAKKQKGNNWKEKREKVFLLKNMQIEKLPIKTQLKLCLADNEFIEKMSLEACEKFVGTNPMLFEKLPKDKKIELIKKNPNWFSGLSLKEQNSLYESEYTLRDIIPEKDRIFLKNVVSERIFSKDTELVKREMISGFDRESNSYVTDIVRDQNALIELAKFDSTVLEAWGYNNYYLKIEHVMNLFKTRSNSPEIIYALENKKIELIRNSGEVLKRNSALTNIAKVILNDRVMSHIDTVTISEFVENPDIDKMKDIIIRTYGKHAEEVFKDRPDISMEQISNLDIFDEKVVEKFGIGTIHNMISYNSNGSLILGDMVRHPDKMQRFDMFSDAVGNYFKNNAIGFEQKLITFHKMDELLKNINPNDLTPERKKNLLLAINDKIMSDGKNETYTIKLESLEDLDNYAKSRNSIYDEYVQKINSPEEIKKAISKRFFGIEYENRKDYQQANVSFKGMIYYYNLNNFIFDERTQNSDLFTSEELDQLELITIIDKINDSNVLKQIYQKMSEREEREENLSPADFKAIREKIPQQYSKELVESLFTVEDAKERVAKFEEGITYQQTEDGFEIVKLHGADFRILIHSLGLNNSGLDISKYSNSADLWKFFENGCSTISGCVIEPEMLYSCASENSVSFGFSNIPIEQVIGMSHHDAHVTHIVGKINPEFDYSSALFNYPDELVRKTAAQITGQESKDPTHEYNEVALYRRYADVSKIKNGTFGGRVMPDYIVTYGNITETHKGMAKALSKEGKPIPIIQIDVNAYGDRTYSRGMPSRKEDHYQERKKGEFVEEVKNTIPEDKEREF